jgi:HEAT repeat protein
MRKKREELDDVTLILRDLKSETWTIRQDAVCRIGRLDEPGTLDELIRRAQNEKWYIREMVAAGIRSIDSPLMAGPLKHALKQGDDCIRDACARSLGLMRCRDAEKLLEKAVSDPDCRVRKTARTALELIRECADY